MRTEGTGGRGNAHIEDAHLLDGVTGTNEIPAGLHRRKCVNLRCKRLFWSRQDGDIYCSEQCDLDVHPEYKPSRHLPPDKPGMDYSESSQRSQKK
jgi:hypothetical protein